MSKFYEIIFKIGAFFRNPGLFKELNKLEHSDSYTKEQLEKIQNEKLTDLLKFIQKHSVWYNKFQGELTPSNFRQFLEPISKPTLLKQIKLFVSDYKFQKVFVSETSGTSGEGLVFPKNLDWDTLNRASMFRGYSWYNINPWDRNGYFWGYNISGIQKYKTFFYDFLQNRFRLFSYDEKEVRRFVMKLRDVAYIHGYSSMIYEVALMAKEMGFAPKDFPKLKMIKGTSEKIFPIYQTVVEEVFGKKIISEYGAAESGIIAFECPKGHMHINEENVIVEEVDGEIVVTNLNSYSFPIVRYRLGDYIQLAPYSVCNCGRQSDVVLDVMGRVGKSIQGKTKKFPSLTLYYIFKNLALNKDIELQYQAYQNEKGRLEMRFPRNLSSFERSAVLDESEKYFGSDMVILISENFNIHTKDGKLKDFITEL